MSPASRAVATLLVAVNIALAIYALRQRVGYADLMLIYWAETVIIGLLNVPKLLIGALFGERVATDEERRNALARFGFVLMMLTFRDRALLAILLYIGITMLPGILERADAAAGLAVSHGPRRSAIDLRWVFAALLFTHGLSFIVNFLFGREFRRTGLI